jgi:hypothetical protein
VGLGGWVWYETCVYEAQPCLLMGMCPVNASKTGVWGGWVCLCGLVVSTAMRHSIAGTNTANIAIVCFLMSTSTCFLLCF